MGKGKEKKKESQLVIRVEKAEKAAFLALCETLDTSAGRELRRFMREFVAARAVAEAAPLEPAEPVKAEPVTKDKPAKREPLRKGPRAGTPEQTPPEESAPVEAASPAAKPARKPRKPVADKT